MRYSLCTNSISFPSTQTGTDAGWLVRVNCPSRPFCVSKLFFCLCVDCASWVFPRNPTTWPLNRRDNRTKWSLSAWIRPWDKKSKWMCLCVCVDVIWDSPETIRTFETRSLRSSVQQFKELQWQLGGASCEGQYPVIHNALFFLSFIHSPCLFLFTFSLSLSLSVGYFFLPPSPISHFAGKLECCRILSYFLSTTDFDHRPLAKEANSPLGFEEIRRKVVALFFWLWKNKQNKNRLLFNRQNGQKGM